MDDVEPTPDPFRDDRILDYLIQPTPAETFFARHWESEPLWVRGRSADYYAALLTRDRLADYLESDDLRHPPVRLARLGGVDDSRYLGTRTYGHFVVEGVVDREALVREYAGGASIVVDRADEIFASLGRCAAALQRWSGLQAQASVFLTPAGAQSFAVHFDPHSLFVLQIAGRKVWRLFDRPAHWPLPSQISEPPPSHGVALEAELVAGDALYVPRGHFHQVVTTSSDSLHVSLGLVPLTWIEVLRQVLVEMEADTAFREAPVEQVRAIRDPAALRRKWTALVDRIRDSEALEGVWRRLERRLQHRGLRSHRGRLRDLAALDEIDATTRAVLRRDLEPVVIEPTGDGLQLCFGGKGIGFPAPLEPVLRAIVDRRSVRAADLFEWLDDGDAVDLVRLLVREGLLTLEPASVDHRLTSGDEV